jgi:hypothetical protein
MKFLSTISKISSTSLLLLSTLDYVAVKGQDKELSAGGGVADYGADVSYAIHHSSIKPSDVFGTSRKSSYEALLQTCRDHGGGRICDANEESRLLQNLLQPQSMKVRGVVCPRSLSLSLFRNAHFHLIFPFNVPLPLFTTRISRN